MRQIGFGFHENMSGTYTRLGVGGKDPQGSFKFSGQVKAASALRHLRDNMATLDGTLDMEGFAEDVPIKGTVEIAPFTKRIIRYEFSFLGDDGKPYRFAGQKDIRFSALRSTFTTLVGAVLDASGQEVARATAKFDLDADLLPFLLSWKPALS